MKEYKVFYVLSRPGLAEDAMETELNKFAKEGWTLHSYSQPDIEHISAILERDISRDISHLKTAQQNQNKPLMSDTNSDTITVKLTRDEIVECVHALDTKILFSSTEERYINASAIEKLSAAYLEQ